MRWSSPAFVCIGLMLLTAVTYWPVIGCNFVNYDDVDYVVNNYDLLSKFTWSSWNYFWTHPVSNNWHPLTMFSLGIDAHLWGENAAGYHATNLALHCLNVALLYLVLRRMTGCSIRSVCVAALFGVHPLHVESVAWISERKDVLSTLFLLLTVMAYVRYASRPSLARYLLVFVLFILGLMSKPMLVTLPVLMLLLDAWPLDRIQGFTLTSAPDRFVKRTPRQLLSEKIPLLLLSLADGITTIIVQESSRAVMSSIRPLSRVANAFTAYFWYLKKTLLPIDLIILYPHPENNFSWQDAGIGLFTFVLISLVTLRFVKTKPHLFVGWAWFVVSLLPVIGLIQVGAQAYADRYAYIPHIGLLTAIVWEIDSWVSVRKMTRLLSAAAFVLVIGLFAALTQVQVGYWKNGGRLWSYALDVIPDNGLAHISLGDFMLANQQYEPACEHFDRGLQLTYQQAATVFSTSAYCGWGMALSRLDRRDEAEQKLKECLKLNPDHLMALGEYIKLLVKENRSAEAAELSARYEHNVAQQRSNMGVDYKVEVELGLLKIREGKLPEAAWHFERATRIAPYSAAAFNNLANAQMELRDYKGAQQNFRKALELNRDLGVAHFNLAAILELEHDREGARHHYAEAYRINPQDLEAKQHADQLSTP